MLFIAYHGNPKSQTSGDLFMVFSLTIQHFIKTHYLLIHNYGYFAVFFLIMLEDFGIPSPGEIILITVSLIAAEGGLNIILALSLAWCGAVIGDSIGFVIGYFGAERLLMRYGSKFGLTPKRYAMVTVFFNRYGGGFVLIARFIEGARQLNGIIAGGMGMKWKRFLLYNSVGAALWIMFWGYGSYVLGDRFFKLISVVMAQSFSYYGLITILVALFVIIFFWLSWNKKKKK